MGARILRRWIAILLAALLHAAPAYAQAAEPAIEGAISYDAQNVPMTYVSARETRPSPDGNIPSKTIILIADRPPPAGIAASRRAYYAAAREGRVRGLLIVLGPSASEAQLVIFAPGGGVGDVSLPDIFSRVELTDLTRQGGWVSGRLRTSEPGEFVGGGGGADEPASYSIDLRFRVAIAPAPVPSEILTGDAARRSPQASAALSMLQLLQTGSAAEIRARLNPNHPAWAGLGTAQAAAVLAAARAVLPSPTTFLQSIQRIVVYGDEAIILGRDGGGSNIVSLRRDAGEWKVADAPIPGD
jgi:hypothetical protein